jgi:hypothetical protein
LTWCIDTLASRYGWTRNYCLKKLYWEEFWEHVKVCANFDAEEKNSELKFQFMLHATKKSDWHDLPLPFPVDSKEAENNLGDKSGINQLPENLQNSIYRTRD